MTTSATGGAGGGRAVEVLAAGPLVTVQDRGRIGLAHLGVSRSGAADRASLDRANRLLGNAPSAAGLEVLLGGLDVRARGRLLVAVSGADCPLAVDGRPVPADAVLDLRPGSRLTLGTARRGLRAYLAVRGGIGVPAVLGSRSRDTLAALGPEPVVAGDLVPVGPSPGEDVEGWPLLDRAPVPARPPSGEVVVLPARPGPRADRLAPGSAGRLWDQVWRVSPDSDRVGVRLDGPPLETGDSARSPSEPLVRGAVQLPPGGRPVVFLADHPVTGGYPVVAVVRDADTDRLAQVRPGQAVRLRRVGPGHPPPDLGSQWWGW